MSLDEKKLSSGWTDGPGGNFTGRQTGGLAVESDAFILESRQIMRYFREIKEKFALLEC